jgi:hypothetical protein
MFAVFLTVSCYTSFSTRRDHVLRHVSRLMIQISRRWRPIMKVYRDKVGVSVSPTDALNFVEMELVLLSMLRCAHIPCGR